MLNRTGREHSGASTMDITPNPAGHSPLQATPADDHPVPAQDGPGANAQPAHPAGGLQALADLRQNLGAMRVIPEEALEHIAYLPPRDVVRVRGTAIQGLRPRLQASPLSALLTRIQSLPPEDRPVATTEFLAAFDSLPERHRTPELTSLAQIARRSLVGFSALAAATHGENVQHTAIFYGVIDEFQIESLESAAAFSHEPGSAGAAARSGRPVQEVADEFGVLSERGMRSLELAAAACCHPERGMSFLRESLSRFNVVPEGPLGDIAAYLPPSDVMSVRGAFIQSLRPQEQVSCLSALALQIHLRSPEERPTAITEFLAAVESLPAEHLTPELTSLAQIARRSELEFDATVAVMHGENVQHTALFFGYTDSHEIGLLEGEAARSHEQGAAGAAASIAQNLHLVAHHFGINSTNGRRYLELQAARSSGPRSAGAAARSGQHMQVVANQFGVITAYGRGYLEAEVVHRGPAGLAAGRGENLQVVADQFGVITYEGRRALEDVSIFSREPGSAGTAAQTSRNLPEVIERFGILSNEGIQRLEGVAACSVQPGSAGDAVRSGRSVDDVYLEFGFSTEYGRAQLREHAAAPQNAQP
jgi:hypothetical protein